MVLLRSGSITAESVDMSEISPEHFALCLATALKLPDIKELLKEITHPNREEFADMISGELHRQLKPLKDSITAKDDEIKELKDTVSKLESKVEELEQHGRRDSLRFAGIPENKEHDDTDTAILNICQAIAVDPPVQPQTLPCPIAWASRRMVKLDKSLLSLPPGMFGNAYTQQKRTLKLLEPLMLVWKMYTSMRTWLNIERI